LHTFSAGSDSDPETRDARAGADPSPGEVDSKTTSEIKTLPEIPAHLIAPSREDLLPQGRLSGFLSGEALKVLLLILPMRIEMSVDLSLHFRLAIRDCD
jgi:hypothetical protein